MFPKKYFALILSLGVVCESSFVDSLKKCPKDDGLCQGKNIQDMLLLSKDGIKEINMDPFDPLPLKLNVTIFEAVQLIFDGLVNGVSKCNVDKFTPNFEDGFAIIHLSCAKIVIDGNYDLASNGDGLKSLLGKEPISGNGKGQLKIDNLVLNFKMHYDLVKRGDYIFMIGKKDKIDYTYNIGKLRFAADNICLGGKESSATIIQLMNENTKPIIQTVGEQFMKISVGHIVRFLNQFFTAVSTEKFIIDDLSPYVTI